MSIGGDDVLTAVQYNVDPIDKFGNDLPARGGAAWNGLVCYEFCWSYVLYAQLSMEYIFKRLCFYLFISFQWIVFEQLCFCLFSFQWNAHVLQFLFNIHHWIYFVYCISHEAFSAGNRYSSNLMLVPKGHIHLCMPSFDFNVYWTNILYKRSTVV